MIIIMEEFKFNLINTIKLKYFFKSKISNSLFKNNSLFGLYLVGELSQPSIISNKFIENKGSGILIGIGSKANVLIFNWKIKSNIINSNKNGIEAYSCQAKII